MWSAVSACGGDCVLQFGCCILPLADSPVAAHHRRVLWVSAMSLFARSMLLLLCGCVFFALFKLYGVPPPRAAAESLHTMQRNIPTPERYLDDWGDQLFQYTFTGLSLCSVYMSSAAVLLSACVCRIRVRFRTCDTTSPSASTPAVQIPSITCVIYAGVYTALLIRCALSMVTAVYVCTAVCTQLSLCVAHT